MRKSAYISDILFTFILVGVFFLCLFRYLGLNIPLALLFAILCGAIAAFGIGLLGQNKRKRLYLKRSEETQKDKLLAHLALLSDAKKTIFFQQALSKTDNVQRFSPLRLTGTENFYFIKLRFAPVSADEIADIFRLKRQNKKFYCVI